MAGTNDNMDYAEHERTYAFFMTLVKFGIVAGAVGVVALYAFIIVGNAWLGLFLLALAVPAGLLAVRSGAAKA